MTYPGLGYQKGPPPQTAVGQQVRQSRAGEYPGFYSSDGGRWTSVLGAMGSHAPAAAVIAKKVTVVEEMAEFPFAIEKQDFELGSAFGGLDEGGLDIGTQPFTATSGAGYFTITFPK